MRRLLWGLIVVALALTALPALAEGRPIFAGRPLVAIMDGAQEVPPAETDGTGVAQVWLNQGQAEVCFFVEWSDLTGPVMAAHIHVGPAGVNGPVVVGFHGPPVGPEFGPTDGPLEGCGIPVDPVTSVPLDEDASRALIKDIRQNPQEYYVNLHTVAFPGGEIRGQLSK